MDARNNPFYAGAGTPPPALVGRETLLEAADIAAYRILRGDYEKSMLINGLRGVGKTVLLNRFREIADRQGYATVTFEATEDGHFLEVFAREVKETIDHLAGKGKLSEAVRRAGELARSLTVTYGLVSHSVDVKLEAGVPKKNLGDSASREADLRRLIATLGEAARDQGSGLFIAIDEMQYLSQEELAAIIAAVHLATQRQLPVFVAGAGLPNLPALAAEAKTYAERLFDFPAIGSLTTNDVRTAILEPAERRGATFTEEAIQEIARITQGYPYFVQEWARDAWNVARTSPIDLDNVHAATAMVRERLDANFFRVRFDRLTPRERLYLRAMAELGSGVHSSGDIARVVNGASTSFGTARNALIEKGMIYSPMYGQTAFSVPLFDEFMRRSIPNIQDLVQEAKRTSTRLT